VPDERLARVTVTRTMAASPEKVFNVVSDPKMHVEIDGSGMLMKTPKAGSLRTVGDSFEMDMDREPLGDIPLGKYKVLNTVTKVEPDHLFEWNIGAVDGEPFGHVYGYEIVALDDGTTEVSLYCDWSAIADKIEGVITFPVVPAEMLEQSLANLERIVTDDAR
jgi:uncharacterized protein YndB with AHSA1/START domain